MQVLHEVEHLRAWAERDESDDGVVLWLNEARQFFPAAAAVLSDLLSRNRSIAIVGSMWPEDWADLHRRPRHGDDPAEITWWWHLERRHRPKIMMVQRFDEIGMSALKDAARSDRRIAAALDAHDGQEIQHLTGGPDLAQLAFDEDETALSPMERGVLLALLDVRRLGHQRPVPATLLAEAAAGYLPDSQRVTNDQRWIDAVLDALCCDPSNRAPGVLRAIHAVRSTADIGPADGYEPNRYLDYQARRLRWAQVPAEPLWTAAVRHACGDDLARLARAARDRHRLRHAAKLYLAAAGEGSGDALWELADMLEEAGDLDAPRRFAPHAASLGSQSARQYVADQYYETGDMVLAEQIYQALYDDGWILAAPRLAKIRADAGDETGAQRLEAEHDAFWDSIQTIKIAMPATAAEYATREGYEHAERRALRSAADGDTSLLVGLARMRFEENNDTEAERLARTAADAGAASPLREMAEARTPQRVSQDLLRYGLEPDGSTSDPW